MKHQTFSSSADQRSSSPKTSSLIRPLHIHVVLKYLGSGGRPFKARLVGCRTGLGGAARSGSQIGGRSDAGDGLCINEPDMSILPRRVSLGSQDMECPKPCWSAAKLRLYHANFGTRSCSIDCERRRIDVVS